MISKNNNCTEITIYEEEKLLEEKKFILKYFEKNYEIKIQLVKINDGSCIRIIAQEENSIVNYIYWKEINETNFKNQDNIFLKIYNNIQKIYKLIIRSFEENKIFINDIKENISFSLIIKEKFIGEEFTFEISLKKKNCNNNDIIGMLCNKMNELEIKNNTLNNKVNELEEEKKNMKNEIKELKFKSDYRIIRNEEELNFLKNRLLKIPGRENSNISLSLKYRLTENGNSIPIFHSICNNIPNNLTLIKTTDGARFGGYTDIAWTSSGKDIIDNNSFCFSLSKNKIYNVIRDKVAISDIAMYGPIFRDNIFYIGEKSLNYGGCGKRSQNIHFSGEQINYEINGGKETFTAIEFEFYQVLFE